MKSRFLSGIVLILILNLLVKPYYLLGIEAEVQNRLGSEVYGNYFALLNFSFLLNILNDLGLSNFYTRYLSKNNFSRNSNFFAVLRLRLVLFLLYGLLTFGLSKILSFSSEENMILLVLVFNQFLVGGIQFSRATFTGTLRFKSESIISVMDRLLLVIICLYLLYGRESGVSIWSFVLAQTVAYGITFVISLVLILSHQKAQTDEPKTKFSYPEILRKSLPYAMLVLLMMFYTRIDAIMIERLLPQGDYWAGEYAKGYRFLDAVNMFALLIASLLLPVFSNVLKRKVELKNLFDLGGRLLLTLGLVVGLLSYFNADLIMSWRYGNLSSSTILNFEILIFSFLPMCITYLYGTLLTANGNLKSLNYMALGTLVANVVLNLIFIKHYGFYGAAMATLLTQWIAAIVQIILVKKILRVNVSKHFFVRFLLLVLVIPFVRQIYPYFYWENWISLTVDFALAVGVIFGLGILSLNDFKKMISLKRK